MAHWRDRDFDDTQPHGSDYRYRRGCRCDECMAWRRADYQATADFYKQQRANAGMDVYVPASGTINRLRALACLGWSARCIAEMAGFSEIHVSRTRRHVTGDQVTTSFARAIEAVYEQLSMQVRDTHHGRKTMTIARKNGWRPPLDWDEGELDRVDPATNDIREKAA